MSTFNERIHNSMKQKSLNENTAWIKRLKCDKKIRVLLVCVSISLVQFPIYILRKAVESSPSPCRSSGRSGCTSSSQLLGGFGLVQTRILALSPSPSLFLYL